MAAIFSKRRMLKLATHIFYEIEEINIIIILISFRMKLYLLLLRVTNSTCSSHKLSTVPEKDATLMFCLSIAIVCPSILHVWSLMGNLNSSLDHNLTVCHSGGQVFPHDMQTSQENPKAAHSSSSHNARNKG